MVLIDGNFNENLSKQTYVVLGSFDGLHKGHRTLINKAIELSKKNNCYSMIYTFRNHPLSLIKRENSLELIMDNQTKIEKSREINIDIACLVDFDYSFMKIEPVEFIKQLLERFNVKGIIVGFNYRFGYKNLGDTKLLKELSEEFGFELYIMDAYKADGEVVSSTRIRKLLKNGEIAKANELLGGKFLLRGTVVDGKKLGRQIGFPTANLNIESNIIVPKIGVYYTKVEYEGEIYKGITSIGSNPTVNGKSITIETYILNFQKNIYGDEIKLYFLDRIRDEVKFNSIEELKNQLKKDKEYAEKAN